MSLLKDMTCSIRPQLLAALREFRASQRASGAGDVALARQILDRASRRVAAIRDSLRQLDAYASQVLDLVETARMRLEGRPARLTPVQGLAGTIRWEDEASEVVAIEREVSAKFAAPEQHLRSDLVAVGCG